MTKILLPLISRQENNANFLDEATSKIKEAIILLTIDNSTQNKFGFNSGELREAGKLLEQVKNLIGQKRKTAKDLTVWGDTKEKIINTAIIQKVDRVVLMRSQEQWFNELEKELRKKLKKEKITVHVIQSTTKTQEELTPQKNESLQLQGLKVVKKIQEMNLMNKLKERSKVAVKELDKLAHKINKEVFKELDKK